MTSRAARIEQLNTALKQRILVLDGAMGTMIKAIVSMRRPTGASGSATTLMS